HINQKNIAIEKILADGFATMYANYLNSETLLRLIDTFTVEGYKVLFRVGLALLTNATQSLLEANNLNEFREVLISESQKLDANTLSRLAFGVYLSRDKFDRLDLLHKETLLNVSKTEELEAARRWPSWDPKWPKQSSILKSKADFLQLWIWLPPQCHIGDFEMLFNTRDDGYNLSALYDKVFTYMYICIYIKRFYFIEQSLFFKKKKKKFKVCRTTEYTGTNRNDN
ncbi:RabGAP/TBC domain-containing protein, partial [Reticulomyxa filosa]